MHVKTKDLCATVEALIEHSTSEELKSVKKLISNRQKAMKVEERHRQSESLMKQKIKKRFMEAEKGFAIVSAQKKGEGVAFVFKRKRAYGRLISVTPNGVALSVDGKRKLIPFHKIVE